MYKVGDVVQVRDDLVVGRHYGGFVFMPGMAHTRGNLVTIRKVLQADAWIKQTAYLISEDSGWPWSDEMFYQLGTTANIDISGFI